MCVCVCVCIVAKEDRDTAAGSVEPWTDNLLNLVFLKIGPLYANENTQTCTHANRNRPTYIAALKIGCVRLVVCIKASVDIHLVQYEPQNATQYIR